MAQHPTIVVGRIDDKDLKESIEKLVNSIKDGMDKAAKSLDNSIISMEGSLKKFSQNVKTVVGDIKDTFKQLGITFDELAKALAKASSKSVGGVGSGGKGGAKKGAAAPDTVGELQEQIAKAEKLLSTYRQWSPELEAAVNKLRGMKKELKDMLTPTTEFNQKLALKAFNRANAMPTRELSQAEAKLAELQRIANLPMHGGLDPVQWQRLQTAIDRTQAKIEKLKETMAKQTPTTMHGVLGMSEKSLDDISRKMQAIAQVRGTLNIQTQASEINRLNAEYQRLSKLQREILGQNTIVEKSNNALARSFGYIRNRVAYALTLGAATSFVKQIYEVRGQYELLERSLGVLVNSFERGSQIFQELNAMAIKSPFTLMELAGAAKQLTAYNFSANEVVDTTRRLADISAALGVPMERLTYNLGQIRAQTVLTARDARDFANAGLPIVKSLSDYYTELEGRVVSTGDVYDRMSKKMVSYNDVMAVLNKMTDEGGKFFDFQAKQADTLRVQLANLTLAWNNMLNELGSANQGILTWPIQAIKTLLQNWRTLDKVIWDIIAVFGILKTSQLMMSLVMGKGNAAITAQIIANKRLIASRLEQKSLTQSLTAEETRLLATKNKATAADYQLVLSSKAITKQQALMMVAFQGRNTELMKAIVRTGLLTAEEVRSMTVGKAFMLVIKSIGFSLKSMGVAFLAALPSFALFAAIGGAIHILQRYNEAAESTAEMNRSIAESAKEAADAMDKFLNNTGNKSARELANSNSLSSEEGAKAWESIRSQIETSSMASSRLLQELLSIDDINERVAKGFDYSERIRNAQLALKDLDDDAIKMSHTTLGEGLVDDLKDFSNSLKEFDGDYERLNALMSGASSGMPSSSNVVSSFKEFQKELDVTANSIVNFIREHNIVDPLEISEIIERAKSVIKSKNPEIQGELANLFDISMDKRMAELTHNAVDENATLWSLFMDTLKRNSSSAFSDITDDIYSSTGKLEKKQEEAIDKTLNYFKESMPFYYDAVRKMVEDSSKLRIQIGIAFNVQQLTDFQKEVNKRILETPILDFGTSAMLPTANDNLVSWVKTQQDAVKKLKEENNKYAKDDSEWSKQKIESNKKEITQRKNLVELFKQSIDEEKKGGIGGNKKDVLGEALSKEVQLITDIQKRFKEYRQIGVDSQTAITKATEEYGNTIAKNNAILQKYGIQTLSSEQLAVLPLQEIREFYKEQIKIATALNNTKGLEALEKALANINVEITKIDYKKITDGLNNELGKLKDEYELAVELDANPMLGNAFADLFGIDTENFPKSIVEYAARVQAEFDKIRNERGWKEELDVLRASSKDWETWAEKVGISSEALDKFKKSFVSAQDVARKWTENTVKRVQDMNYQLADAEGKIRIRKERIDALKKQMASTVSSTMAIDPKLAKYYASDIMNQIQEEELEIQKLQEDVLQMLPTYKALFNSIVEHSAVVTRKLAQQWKEALSSAVANADGTWTITDPQSGKKASVTRKEYGKQIDKVNAELRKTQSTFAKIREAFSNKGEDGLVDWAEGLQLVGNEANKAADGLKTIGEIFAALGASDDTVETINDVANTLEGLSQAGQGVAQIYSGDFIGGTVNVIKGTWKAVSTWLDNSDKKITRNIESSKRAVRRLQNAYEELEYAVEKSMGAAEIGARRAAIENKKLQLAELERQLQLEKSRKKKKQDEDAIIELEGEVASAKRELKDLTDGVVEMLTGSDIKGAAEAFIDAWVQAWRAGENTLDAMNEKMDEMIQNLVKKGVANEIIGTLLDPLYSEIKEFSDEGSEGGHFLTTNEIRKLAQDAGVTAEEINIALSEFYGNLERLGILPKTLEASKQLSDLQQGIQGITEDTAGALEAYMNNVSQQMYLHTDILTQIRDVVVGFNFDAQLGTISQILLQLQYSYQTQMAIHGILEGVLTPSGRAFTVELAS